MAWTSWKSAGARAIINDGAPASWSSSGGTAGLELSGSGDFMFANLTSGQISQILRGRSFGFSTSDIPPGATITGREIRYTRQASTANGRDHTIRVAHNSAGTSADQVGSNLAATATAWPMSFTAVTYGGSGDLGGTTITDAQARSANFSVDIKTNASGGGARTDIDHLEVRFEYSVSQNYTLTASSGSFSLTGGAASFPIARHLLSSGGTFYLAGGSVGLYLAKRVAALAGSFTLAGTSIDLNVSTGTSYNLPAAFGTFVLSGAVARFARSSQIAADAALFELTGADVALSVLGPFHAETGAFSLTGFSVGFKRVFGPTIWTPVNPFQPVWSLTDAAVAVWTPV